MSKPALLVLNAGSSSLKFRLYSADGTLTEWANGRITGIGSTPEFSVNGDTIEQFDGTLDQSAALQAILQWIAARSDGWRIVAAGHRIVHGGEYFSQPVVLDDTVMAQLDTLVPLAPLHQPHALSAIRTLQHDYPDLVQIGCFDTAFHSNHAPEFSHYALPKPLRERGLRRYGFHGLSYEWTAQQLAQHHPQLAQGRVVVAHLGNGSSLCALYKGKSVDTTMGMTALDGLPMGTRCGQIDPGVLLYMLRQMQMDGDSIDRILSYESGLKGLSGISADIRELVQSDSEDARFAVSFYTTMTAQHVARMAVAIGGMDALVFTGGIGENQPDIRTAIVDKLTFMAPFEHIVVKADEERMIAGHCRRIIAA